ncbi:MAG: choice-of-anchor B family protein [Paracoccaceae bacterium]
MKFVIDSVLRPVLACSSLVAAAVLLTSLSASAHDELPAHHKVLPPAATAVMKAFWITERAKQELASAVTLDGSAAAPCIAGSADPSNGDPPYPCDGIDLQSFLPLDDIGGTRTNASGNDIWGWTAPDGSEYALFGRAFGTSFIDISDPTNPVYLGDLPTHGAFGSSWRDIKVYQNHAFIVSEASNHGMQVFDLMQLETMDRAGLPVTFGETDHYSGAAASHNLFINEDSGYAYMVGNSGKRSCAGGLHMVDISTPTNPRFARCFNGDGYTHDVQCVNYHGPDPDYQGSEICFASNEDTVTIVDVTDKKNPAMLSRTPYPGASYTHQGWLSADHGFFILDDELDEWNGVVSNTTTRVLDVTDLDAPALSTSGAATTGYDGLGVYSGPSTSIDHNLYMVGGCAVQANYRSGLRIVDLRDAIGVPVSLVGELGYFDIWPPDDAAAFNGMWSNYAFFPSGNIVASGIEQGLYVLKPQFDLSSACGVPVNAAPVVTVSSPADPTTVDQGTEVTFTAAANDPEDGAISIDRWESSLDGPLSTLASFSTTALSVGTHLVTAFSVADSGGAVGQSTVSVTVNGVGGGGEMHVAALTGGWIAKTNRRWTGEVTISIEQVGAAIAVAGATVSGKWSGGAKGSGSCITDASGRCSVSKGAKLGQTMTFTVNGVTHATLEYAPQVGDVLAITIDEGTPAS